MENLDLYKFLLMALAGGGNGGGGSDLPTPDSTNVGKVAKVITDGSGGYEWGAESVEGLPSKNNADSLKVLQVHNKNTWQLAHINPIEVYVSYFGSLDYAFPYPFSDRSHFVGDKFFKGLEFNGRSADFTKAYQGHIPCIGYTTGKRAYFKGILDETNGTGSAEIYIVIDANSSSGDSITITPI